MQTKNVESMGKEGLKKSQKRGSKEDNCILLGEEILSREELKMLKELAIREFSRLKTRQTFGRIR